MRWTLRSQILLPFAGVMLAVVLGVSLLDAVLAARRTQRRIENQLNEVAKTLREASFPLTDAVLKQTRGLSGAEFVLVDSDGALRAATLSGIEPKSIPPVSPDARRFEFGRPVELGGTSYLHAAIGIPARGATRPPLLLHILYPESFLREARREAAYPPLVVGSLLLLVVIVLAVAIAGRLSRPMRQLQRQLGRLTRGDFRPLAVPRRNDEMRDLICSVNTLGEQMDQFRRAIKRSERLTVLGQLSGGLAHQLRNAITGARIALQLHQRHCRDVDQESLDVSLRQLAMTESHLQRLLAAGEPAAPRRADCDLSAVIAEVAALVGPTCRHRHVELKLPADGSTVASVWADAGQMQQLLMNLVLNALEAAGSGGWVQIELTAESGTTQLRVLDSGPGPTADLVERLFEPFATGKPEGIGLGLSVARQIAQAHGGSIRYVRDEATCFEVTLPDHPPAPDAAPAENAIAAVEADPSRLQRNAP